MVCKILKFCIYSRYVLNAEANADSVMFSECQQFGSRHRDQEV